MKHAVASDLQNWCLISRTTLLRWPQLESEAQCRSQQKRRLDCLYLPASSYVLLWLSYRELERFRL